MRPRGRGTAGYGFGGRGRGRGYRGVHPVRYRGGFHPGNFYTRPRGHASRGRYRGREEGPRHRSFYKRNESGTQLVLVRPLGHRSICKYFARGACSVGDRVCSYSHQHRALCAKFLSGSVCNGCVPDMHVVTEYNRPICERFLQGRCDRGADCVLRHLGIGRGVCEEFVKCGVCALGNLCDRGHVQFCPRAAGCTERVCALRHATPLERIWAQCGVWGEDGERDNGGREYGKKMTGTQIVPSRRQSGCKYYARGICTTGGDVCAFSHEHRALCEKFLAGNYCANCVPEMHVVTEFNRPVCERFLQTGCESGAECVLRHVHAGRSVCLEFVSCGVCALGDSCDKAHTQFCPRYADKGGCWDRICNMRHVPPRARIRAQSGVCRGGEEEENGNEGGKKRRKMDDVFAEFRGVGRERMEKKNKRYFGIGTDMSAPDGYLSLKVTKDEIETAAKNAREKTQRTTRAGEGIEGEKNAKCLSDGDEKREDSSSDDENCKLERWGESE